MRDLICGVISQCNVNKISVNDKILIRNLKRRKDGDIRNFYPNFNLYELSRRSRGFNTI